MSYRKKEILKQLMNPRDLSLREIKDLKRELKELLY
jgi:hypothetical protein